MRRTEVAAGSLALVLGLLHLWLAPHSGTDLSAQLARASFAEEAPLTPIDLSWYGGTHPFAYSLLAPGLMAVLGVGLCGLLAAVASSVLLARLLADSLRPVAASLLGAVFMVANTVSGRTTFGLGMVAGLAALLALPRSRRTAVLGVLTALLSPVAAAFVGLVAAVLVLHRRPGGWTLGLSVSAPVVLLALLFEGGGVQPLRGAAAIPAVLAGLGLAALTTSPLVRTGALLWGLGVLFFAQHDDPFGSNALRLGLLLASVALLATAARSRLLPVALAGLLVWQLAPPYGDLGGERGPRTEVLVAELVARGADRVEVLAPLDHREASDVARRVPLARGWSRQTDFARNRLFYEGTLTAEEYLGWLHEHAVDHVAVPRDVELDFGSTREAELLAGPVPGLREVWRSREWVLHEVVSPTPLATSPATVVSSGRRSVVLRLGRPADVLLHVRWSRWLTVASGDACLERYGDEVRLRVRSAGTVEVGSSLRPRGHC